MEHQVERLVARIEHLERRARLWNGVAVASLALLAGCAALSATSSQPKVLRANRIELTDSEGRTRVVIAAEFDAEQLSSGDGFSGIAIEGPDQRESIVLRAGRSTLRDGTVAGFAGVHVDIGSEEDSYGGSAALVAHGQGAAIRAGSNHGAIFIDARDSGASIDVGIGGDAEPQPDIPGYADLVEGVRIEQTAKGATVEVRDPRGSRVLSTH